MAKISPGFALVWHMPGTLVAGYFDHTLFPCHNYLFHEWYTACLMANIPEMSTYEFMYNRYQAAFPLLQWPSLAGQPLH